MAGEILDHFSCRSSRSVMLRRLMASVDAFAGTQRRSVEKNAGQSITIVNTLEDHKP